jgi:hypothetical protein
VSIISAAHCQGIQTTPFQVPRWLPEQTACSMWPSNFHRVEHNGNLGDHAISETPAYLDFEQASFNLKHYAAISVGSRRLVSIYA